MDRNESRVYHPSYHPFSSFKFRLNGGVGNPQADVCMHFFYFFLQALCADYGFRSGSGRLYQEDYGEVPKSAGELVSHRTEQ